ncbi:dentin sialophosphoprotein-like [Agrilus planipennis]|uniref:Dentin sialophosphoprotein-like n=1 Tax=Agrilus planipennis TaxID=224129 RepID=A0A1W4XRE4_AGRPL|nr:dentin sialophosphoprotein-like [Agrilus planipennis]
MESIDSKHKAASKEKSSKDAAKLKLSKITEKPEQELSTDSDEQLQSPYKNQKESNKEEKNVDMGENMRETSKRTNKLKSKTNGPNSRNMDDPGNQQESSSESDVVPPLTNKDNKRNSKDSTTTSGTKDVKSKRGSSRQKKSNEEPDEDSDNSLESYTTPIFKNKSDKPRKLSNEVEGRRPKMTSSNGKRSAENEYNSDSESDQSKKSEIKASKGQKKRKTETNSSEKSGHNRSSLPESDKVFKDCCKLDLKSEKTFQMSKYSRTTEKDMSQINPYEKYKEKDKRTYKSLPESDDEIENTSTDSEQTKQEPTQSKPKNRNKSGEQAENQYSSESVDELETLERNNKRMSANSNAYQKSEANSSLSRKGSIEGHQTSCSSESIHEPLLSDKEPKRTKPKPGRRKQSFDSQKGENKIKPKNKSSRRKESLEQPKHKDERFNNRNQNFEDESGNSNESCEDEEFNSTRKAPRNKPLQKSDYAKQLAKGQKYFEPQLNVVDNTQINAETCSNEDVQSEYKNVKKQTKILKEAEFKQKMLENSKNTDDNDEKSHKSHYGRQTAKISKDYGDFKPQMKVVDNNSSKWQNEDNCSESDEDLKGNDKDIDANNNLKYNFVESEENRSIKSVRAQDTASLRSKTKPNEKLNRTNTNNDTNDIFKNFEETSYSSAATKGEKQSNKDMEFLYEKHPRNSHSLSRNSRDMYDEFKSKNEPWKRGQDFYNCKKDSDKFSSNFKSSSWMSGNKIENTKYTGNKWNTTRQTDGPLQPSRFSTSRTSKYDYQRSYLAGDKPQSITKTPWELSSTNRTYSSIRPGKGFCNDLVNRMSSALSLRGQGSTTDQFKYKPRALSSQKLHEVDLLSLGPGETLRIKCGEMATSTKACMCENFKEKESCIKKPSLKDKAISCKSKLRCSFHEDSHKKVSKKKHKYSQCLEALKRRKQKCPSPNKQKTTRCQSETSASKCSQDTPSCTFQLQCSSNEVAQPPKRFQNSSCITNQPLRFSKETAKPSTCSQDTPNVACRTQSCPKETENAKGCRVEISSTKCCSQLGKRGLKDNPWFNHNDETRKERIYNYRSRSSARLERLLNQSRKAKNLKDWNCNKQIQCRKIQKNAECDCSDQLLQLVMSESAECKKLLLPRIKSGEDKKEQPVEQDEESNTYQDIETPTSREQTHQTSDSENDRSTVEITLTFGDDVDQDINQNSSDECFVDAPVYCEECNANMQTQCMDEEQDQSNVEYCNDDDDDDDDDYTENESDEMCVQEDSCKVKPIVKPKPKKQLVRRKCIFERFKVSDKDQATYWCRNCEILVRPIIVNKKTYPTNCIKYLFSGCLPQMNINDTLFMCPCCNDYVINMKSSCYLVPIKHDQCLKSIYVVFIIKNLVCSRNTDDISSS